MLCIRSCRKLSYHSVIDLDENRLTKKRTGEWYQHSTPLSTGNLALFGQNSHSSSPLYIHRRRQTSLGNMTSYSALKRKAQRSDVSSNITRVRKYRDHPIVLNYSFV